jgi:prepilin-type N-terminal cleavage/methylation domain-containing protein
MATEGLVTCSGIEVDLVTSTKAQPATEIDHSWRSSSGRTLIEMLVVVAIAAILTSVALPQLISARRLMRSNALPREIATQLRFARQQAMSQRQAFTLQYDDSTKQIRIFDHNNNNNATSGCNMTGTQVLTATNYPNTACSTAVLTVPMAGGAGLPTSEVSFGVPGVITNTTLGDNTTPTALTGTVLNITFQPEGTVLDWQGNFASPTLFLYNNKVPSQTAAAISVLGSSGRIKIWRYDTSANKYAE